MSLKQSSMLLRLGEIGKKDKICQKKYRIWKYCPQMKFHVFPQIEAHAKGYTARWQTHTVYWWRTEEVPEQSFSQRGTRKEENRGKKSFLGGYKVFAPVFFVGENEVRKQKEYSRKNGKKRGGKKGALITLRRIEYQRQQYPDLYSDLCYPTTQKNPVANSSWLIQENNFDNLRSGQYNWLGTRFFVVAVLLFGFMQRG